MSSTTQNKVRAKTYMKH